MAWPLWPKNTVIYRDTPQGILTESGVWYRTTVALLNEYAAEVFEREPIEVHLARADTWIRSPHTLSAWLLALGLIYYAPLQVAVVVLIFFSNVAGSRAGTGESWDIALFKGVGCGIDAGDTLCCNNVHTSYDRSIPGCGCGADRVCVFAVGRIVFFDATAYN